jgi:hypothetical protein
VERVSLLKAFSWGARRACYTGFQYVFVEYLVDFHLNSKGLL